MRAAGTAFVAASIASAALTPVVRRVAHRAGLLDHALTLRKQHGKPIPRLGGIAIVLATYAPLAALFFTSSEVGRQFYAQPHRALGLFAGGIAIAALGVYDDLRGANARQKFAVQFAVAAAMYALGFRVDAIANPFGDPIHLGWLGLPFTVLWIAGVVNAMNLIDGLDGLAGGVALIAIATTFAVSVLRAEPLMVLFTATLAGAVIGFLLYNFNPASIFMGDTGSMFLGFVLATTAIQTHQKSTAAVAIFVPIVALGVPIADTLLAMARRAARGQSMFTADRGHIHHRLLARGLSQRQTVLVLYGASLLLGCAALLLGFTSSSQARYVLLALAAVGYVALRHLGFFDVGRVRDVIVERRRNQAVRREIRSIGEFLRIATDLEDVWTAVRRARASIGADAVALRLLREPAGDPDARSDGFDGAGADLVRVRYALSPGRLRGVQLELGWSDGRASVNRDTEIAIELLCDHLAAALDRIEEGREAAEHRLAPAVNLRR